MLQEPWAQPDKGEFPLVSLTLLLREKNGRETLLLWLLFSSLLKDLLFCAAVGKPALCLVCPGFAAEVTHMFLTTAHTFLLSGLWVHSPAKSLGGALGVLPRRENTGWGAPLGRPEGPQ